TSQCFRALIREVFSVPPRGGKGSIVSVPSNIEHGNRALQVRLGEGRVRHDNPRPIEHVLVDGRSPARRTLSGLRPVVGASAEQRAPVAGTSASVCLPSPTAPPVTTPEAGD